jgi:diguanylate cyclase (GGDEF)-like protein
MPLRRTRARLAAAQQTLAGLQQQVRATRAELCGLQTRIYALGNPQQQAQLLRTAIDAQASALAAVTRLDTLAIALQRDALTDTSNRALLLDRLQGAIAQARRRNSSAAVVFLDVDHFKHINDTLGHATGDAVLQTLARRLQAAVRDTDTVCRHGGDEFLVLLAEVSRPADAALIAKKIIADIGAPSLVCGHVLQVSVSVGLALFPADAVDAQTLIQLADAAMYRSKRRGGGCFTFHADPAAEREVAQACVPD